MQYPVLELKTNTVNRFDVGFGVHQGSVLSPFLFIIVNANLEQAVHGKSYIRVNIGKTMILCSSHKASKPVEMSNFCWQKLHTMLQMSALGPQMRLGHKEKLKPDPEFKCKECVGRSTCLSVPELESVEFEGDEIEVVKSFCYLGDCHWAERGLL